MKPSKKRAQMEKEVAGDKGEYQNGCDDRWKRKEAWWDEKRRHSLALQCLQNEQAPGSVKILHRI